MWKLNSRIALKRLLILATIGAGLPLASCAKNGTCVGVSSCLTPYRLAAETPSANVSVKLDQALAPRVQMQEFSIAENPQMKGRKTFVVMWWGAEPEVATTRVAVGQRVFIRAHARRGEGAGSFSCLNIVSFTPQEGADYDMRQAVSYDSCGLVIRDRSTGQLAADFQIHNANDGLPFFL